MSNELKQCSCDSPSPFLHDVACPLYEASATGGTPRTDAFGKTPLDGFDKGSILQGLAKWTDFARTLERELSEARVALAREVKDAQRYRLWRKNTGLIVPSCTEETIDAELDAAIAARGERR